MRAILILLFTTTSQKLTPALLLLLLVSTCARAQNAEDFDMQFRVWPLEGETRLFWWPTTSDRWARYREQGYNVERRSQVGPNAGEWIVVNDAPIVEATAEEIEDFLPPGRKRRLTMEFLFNPDGTRRNYRANQDDPATALAMLDRQSTGYNVMNMAVDLDYEVPLRFGLGFVDRDFTPGAVYEYRVRPIEYPAVSSDEKWVIGGDARGLLPLETITGSAEVGLARITWPHLGHRYTAYDIYRRRGDDGQWVERSNGGMPAWSKDKLEPMIYVDTLPENGVEYQFAVVGRNVLGVRAPMSKPVSVTGLEDIELPMPMVQTEDTPEGIRVTWEFRDDASLDDVSFYTVHRALSADGGQSRISGPLPPEQTVYIDSVFQDVQWYNVRAHSDDGRYSESTRQSAIADDSIPPPPVTGLMAVADAEGRVELTWDPNPADDLTGYRVFYSNNRHREGARQTDSLEYTEFFSDSLDLRTLADSVYYRVVALDERENVSPFSEPFALAVPDINPPAPPRLRTVTSDTTGLTFVWAPSSSPDVVGYEFNRRALGTDYWERFDALEPTDQVSRYVDRTARDDIRYQYQLVAVDEAGLRGVSNILTAKRLMRVVREPVDGLTGNPQPELNRVELVWSYSLDPGIRAFRILRAAPNEQLTTYRLIEAENVDRRLPRRGSGPAQWRFIDDAPRRDTDYRYAVQVEFLNGGKSLLGQQVEVEY